MRSLQGVLSSDELEVVNTSVGLRFQNKALLKTPEALIVYEQNLLDDNTLLDLCQREYKEILEVPSASYLPKEIIDFFAGKSCVPLRMDSIEYTIHIGVVPELLDTKALVPFRNYSIKIHYIPLYHYVKLHTDIYTSPSFLLPLPVKDLFDFLVSAAIKAEASDITISDTATTTSIFYNVKKRKVYAKWAVSKENVREIAHMISSAAGSPMVPGDRSPKYIGVRLDLHHRGRVVINTTYYGITMTIRVLSDEMLSTTLAELKHSHSTIQFLDNVLVSEEKGLRLLLGPTMSGKNTTILAALLPVLLADELKAVSVENPVEILVPNMVQISAETPEQFKENTDSLLRQNPDLIYASEMTDMTALGVMEISNTGKVVYSSLHANSIAEVYARIQDLTGLSLDRITLTLQSCAYQELLIDEDGELYPKTTCFHFTEKVKSDLLGKSLHEIYKYIREEEMKWC